MPGTPPLRETTPRRRRNDSPASVRGRCGAAMGCVACACGAVKARSTACRAPRYRRARVPRRARPGGSVPSGHALPAFPAEPFRRARAAAATWCPTGGSGHGDPPIAVGAVWASIGSRFHATNALLASCHLLRKARRPGARETNGGRDQEIDRRSHRVPRSNVAVVAQWCHQAVAPARAARLENAPVSSRKSRITTRFQSVAERP